MRSSVRRLALQVATGAMAAGLALSSSAIAQNAANSPVDQFVSNPSQVVQGYPSGGAQLISLIRDVCVAHPEALQAIMGAVKSANKDQQMAFGSGLGQCAQIVVRTNQAYANQIQQAVADSGLEDVNTAFAAVTGNVTIASTGAGGGGGGGAGGGVGGPTSSFGFAFGGTNAGSPQSFGGLHYQTATQNFFTGGAGVNGATSIGSVSPR